VKKVLSNKKIMLAAGVLVSFLTACTHSIGVSSNGCIPLVVTQFPIQRELGRYCLTSDKTFSLTFIHSVSKTPVTDVYDIRGDKIIQTKEIFRAHGAGLPSSPAEPGGLFWEKTENEFILHMERPIPKLVVRTDSLYENRLVLPSGVVNLNQWDDQALLLYVKPETSL
jgi:hypothetical protein